MNSDPFKYSENPAHFDKVDEYTETTCRDRANRAARAIEAYWGVDADEDVRTKVQDLLTDLMHWGDGHDIVIDEVLEDAKRMYEEEQV